LLPSAWAEKFRILPNESEAEPGRFKYERTPYQRGMVDVIAEPGVEEIVYVCGTRIGKTVCQENLLGYWVDNDPGPTLIVRPSEGDVADYIRDRMRPLMNLSLRSHLLDSRDADTLRSLRFDTMPVHFGWAGSPSTLAGKTCRNVIFDECDKFVPFSGRESDPISLGKKRTDTYMHRRKIILASTPTTKQGAIWKAWENCGDRRHFFVPCPHCGHSQRLIFSQIKWPQDRGGLDKVPFADKVEQGGLAYYECAKCSGRIDDKHKPKMLEGGKWITEGQKSKRVGFHISSIYSPWRSFSEIAAEFIMAEGDVGMTMTFRNNTLAEPFEEITATSRPSIFREKAEQSEGANQRPKWAVTVICTVDVQKESLWFAMRAWGYGFRSHLIRCGQLRDFSDLFAEANKPYVFIGEERVGLCDMIAVDGKYRTNEVFEFARRDPSRIIVTQGNPQPTGPMVTPRLEGGVRVLKLNTLRTKDRLNQMLLDGDPKRWLPHADIGDEYAAQMASEHRTWDAKSGTHRWEPKYQGIANHLWDCEANQCALATWLCLDVPEEQSIQQEPEREAPNFLTSHRGKW
jgi:hypothetical protein